MKSQTNAAVDCLFGFTGRPLDKATGLQNNGERWYDSTVGRWMSKDPIGFLGRDANPYRYVGNGVTYAVDPSGLQNPAGMAATIEGMKRNELIVREQQNAMMEEVLAKINGLENKSRLKQVLEAARDTKVFPAWFHRCHAWVDAVRGKIIGFGKKEYYQNDEYEVTYVDWGDGTHGHGGLRIRIKNTGETYYLDDRTGVGIFEKTADLEKRWGQDLGLIPLERHQSPPFWPWEN